MNRYFQKTWAKVLAGMFTALVGTWAVGAAIDIYKVAKMSENMKTVCVGRMLLDLPHEAEVQVYGVAIAGFDIEAFAESMESFRTRVAARETELQAKPDRLGGNKNLESVREVHTDSGLEGKILVHSRNVSEGQSSDGFTYEHYRYEGVALEAQLHGHGISIEVSAKDYDPDLMGNLSKLVAQIVPNPDNRIPTEPGFCLDRAYVRDPITADQNERIVLSAGLPGRPDIDIRFDTMAGTKPDSNGLLARNAASHARQPAVLNLRFTNLRAAPRTIGGLTGDELVERVLEENFSIIYGFEWEVNGTEDNVLVPAVSLRMATGRGADGPVPSSLSQPAALALWDKISSSVRVRPVERRKVSMPAPKVWPLGTVASAGAVCPQSGWWECGEGGNGVGVLGGQRQYLKAGQRMPQALLLPPPTLWERLRGLQPSFESKAQTMWKLADKRSRKRVAPAVPLAQAKVCTGTEASSGSRSATSIGKYVATGEPCPASGWWSCHDARALDGTRWFGQGSLLPAATFAVPTGALGRAPTARVIHRRAQWRLVRLAQDADKDGQG